MPLIVLTGYPCSGLTHRAQQLASAFEQTQQTLLDAGVLQSSKYKIHVVHTHDASHPRSVYDNARTEKQARGVAFTRAKRLCGRDSFVILDGMNYIKGYRYQLWCEAKALGTTSCVVHVGTPIDQCVANNEARLRRKENGTETKPASNEQETPDPKDQKPPADSQSGNPNQDDTQEAYTPDLLNNLIFRYEEPSTNSRWDKPLFTVPWGDPEPPIAAIWTALTGIPHPSTNNPDPNSISNLTTTLDNTTISPSAPSIAPSTAPSTGTTATTTAPKPGSVRLNRPQIKQHQATLTPTATSSSALYSLEKRTSAIISAIRTFSLSHPSAQAALSQSPDSTGISIPVPDSSTPIFIPAHVATAGTTDELAGAGGILALPRLQRLRRQWIALNRAQTAATWTVTAGGLKESEVPDAFVRFLNADFAGEDVDDLEQE